MHTKIFLFWVSFLKRLAQKKKKPFKNMHICSLHKFPYPCPSHQPQSIRLGSLFSSVFTVFTQILWLHPSEYLAGCMCHCCTAFKQCPTVTCSKYKTTNNCQSVRILADVWAFVSQCFHYSFSKYEPLKATPLPSTPFCLYSLHCCY